MSTEQDLSEKLTRLGYPTFQTKPGIDDLSMLYISTRFICGTEHALELSADALGSLIAETLTFWGNPVQQSQVLAEPSDAQAIKPVQEAQESHAAPSRVEEVTEDANTGQN